MTDEEPSSRDGNGGHSSSSSRGIIVHPLADFSSSRPSLFVFDLKKNFIHGQGKSTAKFHAIRKQVIQALPTSPSPGPVTFIIRCLDVLTLVGPPYNEGFGHLLTSALNHVIRRTKSAEDDSALARKLAASLISKTFTKNRNTMDDRIMVKIIQVFDIQVTDIMEALSTVEMTGKTVCADMIIENLVLDLMKKRSYNCAASLIKNFELNHYMSREFFARMVSSGDLQLAAKWAAYLGRDSLCQLVQHLTDIGMFEEAYRYVKNYQLADKFPDARHLDKNSCFPKVLVKSRLDKLYDVEICLRKDEERDLQQNEVFEDSVESCDSEIKNYLNLIDIVPLENVLWVDTSKDLGIAMGHLHGASVVGIDCEWKTKLIKDMFSNKVAILQMATREHVFVFDLVTLSVEDICGLNACIQSVFVSPGILKIGYAVYNDLEQMFHSYNELGCFHDCGPVLDLQHISPEGSKGGLSGLAQMVLGRSMDKKMRMSDWEKRPLSINQLHYAALDAAVLLPIFDHLDSSKIDWRHHVNCFKAKETSSLKPEPNVHKP